MQINEVIVDKRFRDKIPPLSEEEFERLRENILADGEIRDSLVVWAEEHILLDGHNRYRILQENPNLPYTIKEKSFPDEWAATVWVCKNQLGRRNLNELQYRKLIQEEHDARMKSVGGNGSNQYTKVQFGGNQQIANSGETTLETRKLVAEGHNISQNKVRTSVDFGRALDRAEEIAPGIKNEVLSGEVNVRASEIASLKNRTDEEIQEAVDCLRNGERIPKKVKEYVQPTEEITFGSSYTAEDFKSTISTFPEELESSIRHFLDMHEDMLEIKKCKADFILMLNTVRAITDKYEEVANEH